LTKEKKRGRKGGGGRGEPCAGEAGTWRWLEGCRPFHSRSSKKKKKKKKKEKGGGAERWEEKRWADSGPDPNSGRAPHGSEMLKKKKKGGKT